MSVRKDCLLPAGATDGRVCANCETPLVRRQFASKLEPLNNYKRRRCCSNACAQAARARSWVSPDGPPWTATDVGCWVWDGRRANDGYGVLTIRAQPRDREIRAHLWVYRQAVGAVPPGLQLDHLCRNRACVNPDHLEPVTPGENVRRGALARLTPANVQTIRTAAISTVEAAAAFGVTPATISKVRLGQTWRDAA